MSTCSASSTSRSRTIPSPSLAGTSPGCRRSCGATTTRMPKGRSAGSRELIDKQFGGLPADERAAMVGGTLGRHPRVRRRWRPERASLRRARRRRHRRGSRHRPRAMRCLLARIGAPASSSTISAVRSMASAQTTNPPRPSRARSLPPGGAAMADTNDVASASGAQSARRRDVRRGSDASTSSSTTPASSGGRAFRRPTRKTSHAISPCTLPVRSTRRAPRGRTWSSSTTAAS